jgi:phage baseplate assembly protein W
MSLSIKFPMEPKGSKSSGIQSYTDEEISQAIKQNLKMLILTRKGEYVWDSNFGVGLHDYLFENSSTISTQNIESEIRNQITTYMPYVDVRGLSVSIGDDQQVLNVKVQFSYNGKVIPEIFEVEVS